MYINLHIIVNNDVIMNEIINIRKIGQHKYYNNIKYIICKDNFVLVYNIDNDDAYFNILLDNNNNYNSWNVPIHRDGLFYDANNMYINIKVDNQSLDLFRRVFYDC